jgi:hypothetical protein
MTRTLLTAIFLTLFSQTAGAKTVYYCTGTQFTEIKANKLENYEPQNFKFSVDQKGVNFGSDGFFAGSKMLIEMWVSESIWKARDAGDVVVAFQDGAFVAALAFVGEDGAMGLLVAAKCDKF